MNSSADEAKAANESWPDEHAGRGFLADLRRRKVFRVMGAYAVSAWLILQVVDVITGAFPVPDWTMTAAVVILALGFPVAAALSWAFQVTPDGVQLDMTTTDAMPVNRFRLIHFIDIVIILVLVVVVVLLTFSRNLASPTLEGQVRMAVLPLENLSGDADGSYLSSGIADDIRTRLDEIPQLLLAARSSSQSLAAQSLDVRSIGERLGVDHVLEGSLIKDGDRIRVLMQLVDVKTGFATWSKSYNTRFNDVLAMQNNISLVVASQLEVLLTPEVREALARSPTEDAEAFGFFTQANEYIDRPATLDNAKLAESLYLRAIDVDPEFGLAYAGVCNANLRLFMLSGDTQFTGVAEDACERALELAPDDATVHTTLGSLYLETNRRDAAEAAYRKALELNPREIRAFAGLGRKFMLEGNFVDAEARYRTAVEVRPGNWKGYEQLGYLYLSQAKYDEAVRNYQRMLELSPDNASGYNSLGAAFYLSGNFLQAAESFEHSVDITPTRGGYSNTGTMYYYAGDYERAAAMFENALQEVDTDYRLWSNLADALRFIDGRRDEARDYYRRALRLASERIEVVGRQAPELVHLAWFNANLGDAGAARTYLREAALLDTLNAEEAYMMAITYALLDEEELSEASILKAVGLGFPQVIVDATPEFADIRADAQAEA